MGEGVGIGFDIGSGYTGQCRDDTFGRDFADAMVPAVGDVEIASVVAAAPFGIGETRFGAGAVGVVPCRVGFQTGEFRSFARQLVRYGVVIVCGNEVPPFVDDVEPLSVLRENGP